MVWSWLADAVLGIHLGFVLFVVLGGLVVLRRPRLGWIHAPAAAWGVLTEFADILCPLTSLEADLRSRAGGAGYQGGCIEHYLSPVLYPAGLTRPVQFGLGAFALAINLAVYGWLAARHFRHGS
jgi:uncharacterized protein DUF2784